MGATKVKAEKAKAVVSKVRLVRDPQTGAFNGQLAGETKKEAFFSNFRQEHNIELPKVGTISETSLKKEHLTGALLSILDGPKSLVIDGVPVAKTKVYSGEIGIPMNFGFSFMINRVSDKKCKLSANLVSKK